MIKNLAIVITLGFVVFWLGYQSAERGMFKPKHNEPPAAPVAKAEPAPSATPETAPTPLPAHFPDISEAHQAGKKEEFLSLADAFKTCWFEIASASEIAPPTDGEMTPAEAEKLFGKIKKREVLSKTTDSVQLGLLFDTSIFAGGAAGSVTEKNGRWSNLRFRASGRMLHCEISNRCECI